MPQKIDSKDNSSNIYIPQNKEPIFPQRPKLPEEQA